MCGDRTYSVFSAQFCRFGFKTALKSKCILLKINEIQVRHIMKKINIMKLTLPNKCTSFVCYS